MRETTADVIVLGVGTCGEDVSLQLLDAGLDVVGVERSLVGGECAYWACIPSKVMIRAGNVVQEARRVEQLAGHADVSPSWATVAQRVRTEVTGGWDDSFAVERFGQRGGRLIHGYGKLAGPRTVSVGDETITARIGVVIATGSRPVIPPVPGIDDIDCWTTHDAIEAQVLPTSLIILGGGAVGCELGQVFSRFGVQVTIVEGRGHLLAAEEPEAAAVIERTFAAEGIEILTGQHAVLIRREGDETVVELEDGTTARAERLLVATGRRVDLSGLGIETIGIDPDARSIPVDDHMRVTEGVWAMGDVTAKVMMTHVAVYQGAIVAADIIGRDHAPARYDAVPRVTFTDPEVGAVGMTEAKARQAGIDVAVVTKSLPLTFRGWMHATSDGVVKLVFDRSTRTLVGATTAGPNGGETLGMLSLAVHAKIPLEELETMMYAFPTFYGGIGEAIGSHARGVSTVLDPDYEGVAVIDSMR